MLGIDSSQFGLIVSSYTISAGIARIFASSFMDRFGRKAAFLTLYAGFLVGDVPLRAGADLCRLSWRPGS